MQDEKPPNTPDIVLLTAWYGGSKAAGDALVRRHQSAIRRFYSAAATPADIDDLVQKTWLEIMRSGKFPRTEPPDAVLPADLRGFFLSFARFKLLRYYQDCRRTRDIDFNVESLESCLPSVSSAVSEHQRFDRVEQAMLWLPVNQQLILQARYRLDLKYSELAVMFEIPEGTAKSRVRHALQRLQELLEVKTAPKHPSDTRTTDP